MLLILTLPVVRKACTSDYITISDQKRSKKLATQIITTRKAILTLGHDPKKACNWDQKKRTEGLQRKQIIMFVFISSYHITHTTSNWFHIIMCDDITMWSYQVSNMVLQIHCIYFYEMYIPANSKSTEELVTERLSLSNGAETSVGILNVKLNTVLRKPESLLHKRCQLPDSPSLLTYNIQWNKFNKKPQAFYSKGSSL